MKNKHPNCNSKKPVSDGETDFYAEILATETSIPENQQTNPHMMDRILKNNCGCLEEYATDYNADEFVADSVEYSAAYHSTCEYKMVPQSNNKAIVNRSSNSQITEEDDIFPYQGS